MDSRAGSSKLAGRFREDKMAASRAFSVLFPMVSETRKPQLAHLRWFAHIGFPALLVSHTQVRQTQISQGCATREAWRIVIEQLHAQKQHRDARLQSWGALERIVCLYLSKFDKTVVVGTTGAQAAHPAKHVLDNHGHDACNIVSCTPRTPPGNLSMPHDL